MGLKAEQSEGRRLRILFITDQMAPGGAEKYLSILALGINRAIFDVAMCTIYKAGAYGDKLALQGIRFYEQLAGSKWDARVAIRLLAVIRSERPVLVVIVNRAVAQFWGTISAKVAGVPHIVSLFTGMNCTPRLRVVNKFLLRFSERIIVMGKEHKAFLQRFWNARADRVDILYSGIRAELYRSANVGQRSQISPAGKACKVGIVARLEPVKRHDVFLHAAKLILEARPETEFVIVGDGTEYETLNRLAESLGILPRTLFLGYRTDVPDILTDFDICILCSDSEGFPNVMLEYMAAGKPVVATNVGSISEQITDGITGFLVPRGDPERLAEKVLQLIDHHHLRESMGRAGREFVLTHFTEEIMIQNFESIVRTLTGVF